MIGRMVTLMLCVFLIPAVAQDPASRVLEPVYLEGAQLDLLPGGEGLGRKIAVLAGGEPAIVTVRASRISRQFEVLLYRRALEKDLWDEGTVLFERERSIVGPAVETAPDGTLHLVWLELGDRQNELFHSTWKAGQVTEPQRLMGVVSRFVPQLDFAGESPCVFFAASLAKAQSEELILLCSNDGGSTWSREKVGQNDPLGGSEPLMERLDEGSLALIWNGRREAGTGTFFSRKKSGEPPEEARMLNDDVGQWTRSARLSARGKDLWAAWLTREAGAYQVWLDHSEDGGLTWGDDLCILAHNVDALEYDLIMNSEEPLLFWKERSGRGRARLERLFIGPVRALEPGEMEGSLLMGGQRGVRVEEFAATAADGKIFLGGILSGGGAARYQIQIFERIVGEETFQTAGQRGMEARPQSMALVRLKGHAWLLYREAPQRQMPFQTLHGGKLAVTQLN